jgi:hypothetical protein
MTRFKSNFWLGVVALTLFVSVYIAGCIIFL